MKNTDKSTSTSTSTNTNANANANANANRYQFVATGVVANSRLSPLLPADWVDITATSRNYYPGTKKIGGPSSNGENEKENNDNAGSQSNSSSSETTETTLRRIPDFLWENAPRHETKNIRGDVTVYSHLPNGINILDSKWVLGRIFANQDDNTSENPLLATCETHCFSGLDGYQTFARSVKLLAGPRSESDSSGNGIVPAAFYSEMQQQQQQQRSTNKQVLNEIIRNLPDIAKSSASNNNNNNTAAAAAVTIERPPIEVMNWWVVKDAGANGAGGVWVVGSENALSFGDPRTSPMIPTHKYVAQQYVWPPVLYEGKKCHVRVYVTVTCDGKAFVHKRAFLHVANDMFAIVNGGDDNGESNSDESFNNNNNNNNEAFDDCIHITNCCANSHDDTKFAGEILADFGETEYTTWGESENQQQPIVPLADFFSSVKATVSAVVRKTFKLGLLNGGQKNNGFEYCGMDFMLSYRKKKKGADQTDTASGIYNNENINASSLLELEPVAYLLEINSPPSQDTASSLPHAEDLHNEVLRDWMTFWVIPRIDPTYPIRAGGWLDCGVNHGSTTSSSSSNSSSSNVEHDRKVVALVLPSKAAMLNKIRWALFECKVQKKEYLLVNGKSNSNAKNNANNDKGNDVDNDKVDDDNDCKDDSNYPSAIQISRFARSQFPFFSTHSCFTDDDDDDGARGDRPNRSEHSDVTTTQQRQQQQQQQTIFFENAGGAQVPNAVIDHMTSSLTKRHREKIGTETKAAARETLRRMLVGGVGGGCTGGTGEKEKENNSLAPSSSSVVVLGLNATSLLASLAQRYARLLTPTDEVLISTENHLANFDPWIEAAKTAGAKIKLWAPFHDERRLNNSSMGYHEISSNLNDLVTPQTRIVALPHASNVLGSVRPIADLSKMIKTRSRGYAHIVVDGVAVAPHEFVGFDENFGGNVDWYVVSMHKLFGPHIGVLLARQNRSLDDFLATADASSFPAHKTKEERIQALLESGTANIEGCAGVVGLGVYFKSLSKWYHHQSKELDSEYDKGEKNITNESHDMISLQEARLAYRMIRKVEVALLKVLLRGLYRCPRVRILDGSKLLDGIPNTNGCNDQFRLPTVSFVHNSISSRDIYTYCQLRGIICRNGFFLCTKYLAADLNLNDHHDGVLRVSLAHYNTPQEVQILCDTLESMPKWFGDL
jgi:selenocysteine lyase/cysteine desulfurase